MEIKWNPVDLDNPPDDECLVWHRGTVFSVDPDEWDDWLLEWVEESAEPSIYWAPMVNPPAEESAGREVP